MGWDYLHYECRKFQSTELKNAAITQDNCKEYNLEQKFLEVGSISIRPPTVQRILKELAEEDWYYDFFQEYSFIESQRYSDSSKSKEEFFLREWLVLLTSISQLIF
ncbi:hypothetical protein SUGI_1125510 [Cryptomeria japonica]|nr:hypothetical protein SUGI_1125510 [Cryptomeria japonica]